jgi:4-amino-4-deoxy-L-arabinose transferase-like glycosyltransferase
LRRDLVIVLLIAVVLRLAFSLGFARSVLGVSPEREITDGYHQIAENLFHGDGYRQILEHPPTVQRPPGYPVLLFLLFHLAGVNYLFVQIVQALLGALGCWLLFALGRWVLSTQLGLAAASLYAVYPNSIEYASRLYAENLYFPLFLGFALLLCRAAAKASAIHGLFAGAMWGAATLTRGTLLALPFVLPVWFALSRRHRAPASRWLRWALPAALAALVTLAPWTIRNYRLTGEIIPVSSWGWAPFYHGIQCSKRMLAWDDLRKVDKEAEVARHATVVERLYGGDRTKAFASAREYVRHEAVARDLVLDELSADPLGAIARAAVGVPFTWFQTLGPRMRLLSLGIHLPLMILFVAGVVRMRRAYPEAFARAYPALGLVLFVNLFQAVVFPHVRYMSPAIALSFLFAGLPLCERAERFHGLSRGTGA